MINEVKFSSRKSIWIGAIFWGSILISIWCMYVLVMHSDEVSLFVNLLVFLVVGLSGGLLLWIWFDTRYILQEKGIRYLSGPIRGFIPYNTLREIEVGRTSWIGTRPALSTGGIILRYNTYDNVYISPDTNEKFVNELRRRVEGLKVKYHT